MSDAIEAALKAYDNAMMNIPMVDCTECGGTGVVITGVGIDAGGSPCPTCDGLCEVVADGWSEAVPMRGKYAPI